MVVDRKRILVLKHRYLGHYHLAQGVAKVIGLSIPVDIQEVDVWPRLIFKNSSFTTKIMPLLRHFPRLAFRLLYKSNVRSNKSYDIIITAGSGLVAAAVLLSKNYNAKSIFCGGIAKHNPNYLDLVLTPFPNVAARGSPYFKTLMPSNVEYRNLRPRKTLRSAEDFKNIEVAFLVGGPTERRHYKDDDWDHVISYIKETRERFEWRWRVSTSRRTPKNIIAKFEMLFKDQLLNEFINFNEAGPGSSLPLFNSDVIFVSEDSSTMISEAIASGRPTMILLGKEIKQMRHETILAELENEKKVTILPIKDLKIPDSFHSILNQMPLDHDFRYVLSQNIVETLRLAK